MNRIKQIFSLLAFTGGMISFNTFAADCPAGLKIPAGTYKPFYTKPVPNYPGLTDKFINIGGCEYKSITGGAVLPDGSFGSYGDFSSTGNQVDPGIPPSVIQPTEPDDKPDDNNPSDKPDNPGDSGSTGDGSTPPDNPSSPDYSKPAQPEDMQYVNQQLNYINTHTPDQLYKNYRLLYDNTRSWADNRAVYTALVNKLRDYYAPTYRTFDLLKSSFDAWETAYYHAKPKIEGVPSRCLGGIVMPDDCEPYVDIMSSYSKYVGYISSSAGKLGSVSGINDPDYATYKDYQNGITRCDIDPSLPSCTQPDDKPDDKPGDNPGGDAGDKPGGDTGNKPGGTVPPPGGGSGSGSTDKDGNGDVVAAINAFHADNNKNHKELMDDLNKKPSAPDYTGMEGEFSSTVGGAMSGLTDSVKSAWDAGKAAFGEGLAGIDAMLPDIKTAFDLPPGFEAASTGRCIPVVLDFTIRLVGIPDYHFHAVGTQVCLLYDQYIRPVLNFCMVILSFFVIHRLLVRSAEFLTDGRH
ncbi:hypothetical protein GT147_004079 [Salmonella enterica]|nr:hypothetical protein [Salmonella enterica]